nr:hypothetical protein [Lachnospiraceae bacterium]
MFIGRCTNCKFLDLVDGKTESICPRCSGRIVSLGISTDEWNSLSQQEKDSRVSAVFTEQVPQDGIRDPYENAPSHDAYSSVSVANEYYQQEAPALSDESGYSSVSVANEYYQQEAPVLSDGSGHSAVFAQNEYYQQEAPDLSYETANAYKSGETYESNDKYESNGTYESSDTYKNSDSYENSDAYESGDTYESRERYESGKMDASGGMDEAGDADGYEEPARMPKQETLTRVPKKRVVPSGNTSKNTGASNVRKTVSAEQTNNAEQTND